MQVREDLRQNFNQEVHVVDLVVGGRFQVTGNSFSFVKCCETDCV